MNKKKKIESLGSTILLVLTLLICVFILFSKTDIFSYVISIILIILILPVLIFMYKPDLFFLKKTKKDEYKIFSKYHRGIIDEYGFEDELNDLKTKRLRFERKRKLNSLIKNQ